MHVNAKSREREQRQQQKREKREKRRAAKRLLPRATLAYDSSELTR